MKIITGVIVVILFLMAVYLTLWPVPVDPVQWIPPQYTGYTGPYSVNTKLSNLKFISLKGEEGPEHIAMGPDGKLYTTVLSRNIIRMNQDGTNQEVFVKTDGRVLGFDFDAKGNLIAADVDNGLISISPDKKITVLTNQVNGSPIRYADAVIVAKSGKIYFSDASTRFAPRDCGGTFEASVLDILEQRSTGRLLEYDPATKATRIVARGFSFANGVALSLDEQWIFLNETGKFRIWKISVKANNLDISCPDKSAQILIDNLPGYPDNLMRGLDGKIWVGMVKPRTPALEKMTFTTTPFLRKMNVRLPRFMWPVPKPYGHVAAFTEDGRIVADLQDPKGTYPETTAVTETVDKLYIQSLHARDIGWLSK